MKYPMTPEYLDGAPEKVVKLFRALEIELLDRICSRLNISDKLNEVTVESIRSLRSLGIPMEDIKNAIKEMTDRTEDELNTLFEDVARRNRAYYSEVATINRVTEPLTHVGAREINAIRDQTLDELRNITQSMGFLVRRGGIYQRLPAADAYQWALDKAVSNISFGSIGYNEAIEGAVRELADSGLKVVEYGSGHRDHIDVAARRAVMTGVSQLSDQYTQQAAERLQTDLYEISAHRGARDTGTGWQNHKAWQGKVYSESDDHPKYPSIYEVCGLGKVDGLGGANCRHRRFVFIDGVSERTYTDEELKNIDPPPFEYEGKTYTAYEATQKQREIERTLRKLKRREQAYRAAGLEEKATATGAKIRRLTREYKEFSRAAGLPEQMVRSQVTYDSSKLYTDGFPKGSKDVTASWKASATPNSHIVQDMTDITVDGVTYEIDGHNVKLEYSAYEKEIAEVLERELGGELYMAPKVNKPQGVATPDYFFRGERLELKTPNKNGGNDAIFQRVQKGSSQAFNFVVDISESPMSTQAVEEQIEKVFTSQRTLFVDLLIVVKDGKVWRIVERA